MPEVFTCEQRSDEWFRLRMGIPTASGFDKVQATGKTKKDSKTRSTYMLKLAGEIITGEPMESFTNAHMERGQRMEPDARELYAFMTDTEVEPVGFIRDGDKGASPDGLIGEHGLLEIKTTLPHLLIPLLLSGDAPPEHTAQVQGQLWVADRQWCDLVVYWPKMPLFIKRIERDEGYINKLSDEVRVFNRELRKVVEKVKAYQ
jgi:hypothetical protein